MTEQLSIPLSAIALKARVWEILEPHKGINNRIGLASIMAQCGLSLCETSRRNVMSAIESLKRKDGKRIGSIRNSGGGYFIAVTLEDRLVAARQYMKQARTEFETAKIFLDPQELLELRGQERIPAEMFVADACFAGELK